MNLLKTFKENSFVMMNSFVQKSVIVQATVPGEINGNTSTVQSDQLVFNRTNKILIIVTILISYESKLNIINNVCATSVIQVTMRFNQKLFLILLISLSSVKS